MTTTISNRTYQKRLFRIAVPIMVSNLISQLQMLIDRIFLGRLDLGAMSAVGNASTPIWTCMSTIFSLTIGSTILASQAVGAGDRDKAKQIIASTAKYNCVISLILFAIWCFFPETIFRMMRVPDDIIGNAVSYARIYSPSFLGIGLGAAVSCMLQVSERTGFLVVYGAVRSGVNIVLDYIMIFGHFGFPRLEVTGAAVATLIAEYAGMIIAMIYVLKAKDLPLWPKLSEILKAKAGLFKRCVALGIPSAAEDFAWNIGNLYLIVMLNHVSSIAAGIYSVIFGVECIPIVIIGSLGSATLTLAGQETGRGNYRDILRIVRIALCWCLGLGIVILVLFGTIPTYIMSLFTTDKELIAASAVYLLIVAVDLFPKSVNIVVGSGIKGYGSTRWMLGTQLFGTAFIISCSSFLILVLHLGMTQLFVMVVADEMIRGSINMWKLFAICRTDNHKKNINKVSFSPML